LMMNFEGRSSTRIAELTFQLVPVRAKDQ